MILVAANALPRSPLQYCFDLTRYTMLDALGLLSKILKITTILSRTLLHARDEAPQSKELGSCIQCSLKKNLFVLRRKLYIDQSVARDCHNTCSFK